MRYRGREGSGATEILWGEGEVEATVLAMTDPLETPDQLERRIIVAEGLRDIYMGVRGNSSSTLLSVVRAWNHPYAEFDEELSNDGEAATLASLDARRRLADQWLPIERFEGWAIRPKDGDIVLLEAEEAMRERSAEQPPSFDQFRILLILAATKAAQGEAGAFAWVRQAMDIAEELPEEIKVSSAYPLLAECFQGSLQWNIAHDPTRPNWLGQAA